MGYTFEIDGEHYQKCRYMAFMPTLSMENNPYIKLFLKNELVRHRAMIPQFLQKKLGELAEMVDEDKNFF